MIRLIVFASLMFPSLAYAAGLEVAPPSLELVVPRGEVITQELVVANPTADVQVFEVSADGFTNSIELVPASFTLESGGRKVVMVEIDGDLFSSGEGILQTNLSVVAKPLADSRFQAGTGVKVPVSITVADESSEDEFKTADLVLFFATVGLIILTIYYSRSKVRM